MIQSRCWNTCSLMRLPVRSAALTVLLDISIDPDSVYAVHLPGFYLVGDPRPINFIALHCCIRAITFWQPGWMYYFYSVVARKQPLQHCHSLPDPVFALCKLGSGLSYPSTHSEPYFPILLLKVSNLLLFISTTSPRSARNYCCYHNLPKSVLLLRL